MPNINIIRDHKSLTYNYEKKLLDSIAVRLPLWATPDFLTGIGIIGAMIVGTSYLFSKSFPWLFGIAAAGWIIHWFGDSLDGTIARLRKIERPRYGHYLDHFVDSLVTLYAGLGFAFSGHSRPIIWVLVLISYYLISIHSYLLAAVIGRLKLSYGLFGPTEMRIIFIIFSLGLWIGNPEFEFTNLALTAADILGLGIVVFLLSLFISYGIKNARELDALDRKL